MSKLNNVWQFVCRNKYLCIFVFFILLIGVIDENSFLHRMEMQSRISQLQSEIRLLRENNERDSLALKSLLTDLKSVRNVARTRYLMKRENEEVFVFVDSISHSDNN